MNFEKKLIWSKKLAIVPQPKQSTKFTKNGFAYTPTAKRDYQTAIKNAIINGQISEKPFDCPLAIEVVFSFPISQTDISTKAKKKAFDDNGGWIFAKSKSNDLDNLCKPLCDALNKVIIVDDGFICVSNLIKIKSLTPYIEVKLYELITKTME